MNDSTSKNNPNDRNEMIDNPVAPKSRLPSETWTSLFTLWKFPIPFENNEFVTKT